MRDIKIVQGSDWDGLYVDNKLYYEGHSIPYWIFLQACGVSGYKSFTPDDEWLTESGSLPENFEEVKFEKLVR